MKLVGTGSTLLQLSYKLIEERKEKCKTKYMERFLRSCSPFKAKIGPFAHLGKDTIVYLISTIIDNIVTLLLI